MNWRHRLKIPLVVPIRWTHVQFWIQEVGDENNYIYFKNWGAWSFEDCTDVDWEEFTIYIDQKEYGTDPGWKVDKIQTNGEALNLKVTFYVTGFPPFSFLLPLFPQEWYITVSPTSF